MRSGVSKTAFAAHLLVTNHFIWLLFSKDVPPILPQSYSVADNSAREHVTIM